MLSIINLFEEQIPTRMRTKVEIYIIMPDKKLLVGKLPHGDYLGAGGGVEEGQSLIQAAKMECLEELGVQVKNIKFLNKDNPFFYDFQKKRKNETAKVLKRRKIFRGLNVYYGYADFVKIDESIYGRDNDAMPRAIITKQELIQSKLKFMKYMDPDMAKFQLEMIRKIPV
jgi:8-oxo-dGTP pyrophosphatase MutT (NUDIX family)